MPEREHVPPRIVPAENGAAVEKVPCDRHLRSSPARWDVPDRVDPPGTRDEVVQIDIPRVWRPSNGRKAGLTGCPVAVTVLMDTSATIAAIRSANRTTSIYH